MIMPSKTGSALSNLKQSSFLDLPLNLPLNLKNDENNTNQLDKRKVAYRIDEAVIPDSQEEYQSDLNATPLYQFPLMTQLKQNNDHTVEIPSEEKNNSPRLQSPRSVRGTTSIPGEWPQNSVSDYESSSDEIFRSLRPKPSRQKSNRIVYSSSESENEIRTSINGLGVGPSNNEDPFTGELSRPKHVSADWSAGFRDDSVLVFDTSLKKRPISRIKAIAQAIPNTPGGGSLLISDRTPPVTPTRGRKPVDVFPLTISPSPSSPLRTKPSKYSQTKPVDSAPVSPRKARTSKKALEEAAQRRREAYAQELYNELNESVFDKKLPSNTTLVWNKRLQTTAGKARWHRSHTNVETSTIELACKILVSDERIRNTLSHEMCHLACWTINGDPKEGHGRIWKGWIQKVMKKRPDIMISTKHAYEIDYKFQWKCSNCTKIYGRHSKSIDPDLHICVCQTGKLIPLFNVRKRVPATPKTKADSLQAAGKSRDSPGTVTRASKVPTSPQFEKEEVIELPSSSEEDNDDDDVADLVNQMNIIDLTSD